MTTQLQKSYAELSQAGALAVATEMCGDFRKSKALKEQDFVSKYIKSAGSGSFADEYGRYTQNGTSSEKYTISDLINTYDTQEKDDYDCGRLKSGASFCVNKYGDGYLDTNSEKGPNLLGRDLFMIGFSADGTVGEYDHFLRSIIRADWDIDKASSGHY